MRLIGFFNLEAQKAFNQQDFYKDHCDILRTTGKSKLLRNAGNES